MAKRHPLLDVLETERFSLQPLGKLGAFRIGYYNWNGDGEIMRNLVHSAAPLKPWRWLRRMVWTNGRTKFSHAIVPKEGGPAIGMHIVNLQKYRSASLTVVVHDRAWWGKKVVAEVRGDVIDYVFRNNIVDRVCCTVNARNMPSVFNYKKLGFTHVGTLHRAQCDPVSGEVFDTLIFELMRADWNKQGKQVADA